jgi:hypothetical protein
MDRTEMKKKIDENDRIVKKAIAYMEDNPSIRWTPERRDIAEKARKARQERDRLVSMLEKADDLI